MRIDERGPTNPEAGVLATRPATAPLTAPSTVGFPRCDQSIAIPVSAAAAAARWVTTKALTANAPDASALPPLNPTHPNQRIPAPKTVIGRLWGGIGSLPYPIRFPI